MMETAMSSDPVIKPIVCPTCKKTVNVRVLPEAKNATFHCPHCKGIQKTAVA